MKPIDLFSKVPAVLMLSFVAMASLPACSSSEEESSSGGGCGDTSHCAQEDLECKEMALLECDI